LLRLQLCDDIAMSTGQNFDAHSNQLLGAMDKGASVGCYNETRLACLGFQLNGIGEFQNHCL
jgi:hypothetical protein